MSIQNGLPSVVKSVQQVTLTFAANVAKTAAITAVDVTKSVAILNGASFSAGSQPSAKLTSSVQVTGYAGVSATGDMQVTVIEYV